MLSSPQVRCLVPVWDDDVGSKVKREEYNEAEGDDDEREGDEGDNSWGSKTLERGHTAY